MHEKIADESQREATFDKKVDELLKEANDLSTLCGVEMGIFVHKEGEDNAVMWPFTRDFHRESPKVLELSGTAKGGGDDHARLASFASEMLRKIGNREKQLEGEGSGSSSG
ncbi:AGAMOUS-like 87 [Striga hermonthica]|uniref:AGAMOUS-like 87 n=1 Tax=Striga hermonthica TaxID=68872 RepID=A0A9N7NUS8_STRHE|nr:AGAMOUS-like 87 [Striga hermonthica]